MGQTHNPRLTPHGSMINLTPLDSPTPVHPIRLSQARRSLAFRSGQSAKFWQVEQRGEVVVVLFGRIGTGVSAQWGPLRRNSQAAVLIAAIVGLTHRQDPRPVVPTLDARAEDELRRCLDTGGSVDPRDTVHAGADKEELQAAVRMLEQCWTVVTKSNRARIAEEFRNSVKWLRG